MSRLNIRSEAKVNYSYRVAIIAGPPTHDRPTNVDYTSMCNVRKREN